MEIIDAEHNKEKEMRTVLENSEKNLNVLAQGCQKEKRERMGCVNYLKR